MYIPGPWSVIKNTKGLWEGLIIKEDKSGFGVANVHLRNMEVNANLIAAAPDLLAACIAIKQKIQDLIDQGYDCPLCECHPVHYKECSFIKVSAAIKKVSAPKPKGENMSKYTRIPILCECGGELYGFSERIKWGLIDETKAEIYCTDCDFNLFNEEAVEYMDRRISELTEETATPD